MIKVMVAGLIIQESKLLLIHNTKHGTLRIEPPGGKVHNNEILRGAVKRELLEELGITVKVGSLFEMSQTVSPEGKFTVCMYFCEIIEGKPKNLEPEKSNGFGWYSFTDLERLAEEGKLVPNMVSNLDKFKEILTKPTP